MTVVKEVTVQWWKWMDSEYILEAGAMEVMEVLDVKEKRKCREYYFLCCNQLIT